MTKWTDIVIPTIDRLEEDRARIVLEVGGQELGVLYFEKAKKGWTKQTPHPRMDLCRCQGGGVVYIWRGECNSQRISCVVSATTIGN